MGGAPVFRGTRVPLQALFDYLEGEKRSKNSRWIPLRSREWPSAPRRSQTLLSARI